MCCSKAKTAYLLFICSSFPVLSVVRHREREARDIGQEAEVPKDVSADDREVRILENALVNGKMAEKRIVVIDQLIVNVAPSLVVKIVAALKSAVPNDVLGLVKRDGDHHRSHEQKRQLWDGVQLHHLVKLKFEISLKCAVGRS